MEAIYGLPTLPGKKRLSWPPGRRGNKKGPTRVGPWLNTQLAYLLPAFVDGWAAGEPDGMSDSFGFNFSSRISTPASCLSFAM